MALAPRSKRYRPELTHVIRHLSRYRSETLVILSKKLFPKLKENLLYYLLLLLLLVEVVRGGGKGIVNSFLNGQSKTMRDTPCQKPKYWETNYFRKSKNESNQNREIM